MQRHFSRRGTILNPIQLCFKPKTIAKIPSCYSTYSLLFTPDNTYILAQIHTNFHKFTQTCTDLYNCTILCWFDQSCTHLHSLIQIFIVSYRFPQYRNTTQISTVLLRFTKTCRVVKTHIYFNNLMQTSGNWCKLVQTGTNWCKLVQNGAKRCKLMQTIFRGVMVLGGGTWLTMGHALKIP